MTIQKIMHPRRINAVDSMSDRSETRCSPSPSTPVRSLAFRQRIHQMPVCRCRRYDMNSWLASSPILRCDEVEQTLTIKRATLTSSSPSWFDKRHCIRYCTTHNTRSTLETTSRRTSSHTARYQDRPRRPGCTVAESAYKSVLFCRQHAA